MFSENSYKHLSYSTLRRKALSEVNSWFSNDIDLEFQNGENESDKSAAFVCGETSWPACTDGSSEILAEVPSPITTENLIVGIKCCPVTSECSSFALFSQEIYSSVEYYDYDVHDGKVCHEYSSSEEVVSTELGEVTLSGALAD